MIRIISKAYAAALGDVRVMGLGDRVIISEDATSRKDWPRYQDALNVAQNRGADVIWSRVPAVPTVPFTKGASQ